MLVGLATAAIGLLSKLPGLAGEYFAQQAEIKRIQLETEKQIALERQKLAAIIAENEYKRAETALNATGRWFKYFTFVMWFAPYAIGLVSPTLSKAIFHNLAIMPEWYVQSVVMIMFVIWGVSASSPVVGSIFHNMGVYFKERRQQKIEYKAVDKKAFFDGLRAAQGFVTQQDVDKFNKILEQINVRT